MEVVHLLIEHSKYAKDRTLCGIPLFHSIEKWHSFSDKVTCPDCLEILKPRKEVVIIHCEWNQVDNIGYCGEKIEYWDDTTGISMIDETVTCKKCLVKMKKEEKPKLCDYCKRCAVLDDEFCHKLGEKRFCCFRCYENYCEKEEEKKEEPKRLCDYCHSEMEIDKQVIIKFKDMCFCSFPCVDKKIKST